MAAKEAHLSKELGRRVVRVAQHLEQVQDSRVLQGELDVLVVVRGVHGEVGCDEARDEGSRLRRARIDGRALKALWRRAFDVDARSPDVDTLAVVGPGPRVSVRASGDDVSGGHGDDPRQACRHEVARLCTRFLPQLPTHLSNVLEVCVRAGSVGMGQAHRPGSCRQQQRR